MQATERIARFISETPREAIPSEAREAARRALLDTIGVMLAGAREPAARLVQAQLADEQAAARASVVGSSLRSSPALVAWANGTAAHALDYDDVTRAMSGHPSVPVVPAALALAEAGEATGADLVDAYLIGIEVECTVGRGLGRSHYERGWHATATLGTLGATAASARLLGLSAAESAQALGVAASMAGGMHANFGTMTKPLHAGNAARNGVLAAQLAGRGFTAADDIVEAPMGFVRLFTPEQDHDLERVAGLGEPWEVIEPGLAVKRYPCCYAAHRAADAVITLAERHDLAAEQVQEIVLHVGPGGIEADGYVGPMRYRRPKNGTEAKFSLEYVLAAALTDRQLVLATFEDDAVRRTGPEAPQALLARVRTVEDAQRHPLAGEYREPPGGDAGGAPHGLRPDQYAVVEIRLADGRVLTECVTEPRGGPANPLSWEELEAKYRDCGGPLIGEAGVSRSLELLRDLDTLGDVRELTRTLVPT